jgi:hypothetical protein
LQPQVFEDELTIFRTVSGPVLHYPLESLFAQIPVALQPKISKSIDHQQKDELTTHITRQGSQPRSVREEYGRETLITIIYSAAPSSIGVCISKEDRNPTWPESIGALFSH